MCQNLSFLRQLLTYRVRFFIKTKIFKEIIVALRFHEFFLLTCHFWFRNLRVCARSTKRKQMLQPETGSRVVSCHRTTKLQAEYTAQKLAKT